MSHVFVEGLFGFPYVLVRTSFTTADDIHQVVLLVVWDGVLGVD